MANYQGLELAMQRVNSSLQKRLGEHYNATLTFQQGSGELTVNPITGNYDLEILTPLLVQVKFRETKPPDAEVNQGINRQRTYLEGYLVDPVELDGNFAESVDCQLIQNNSTVSGKFVFLDNIPSTLKERYKLQIGLGQKIKGYFERLQGNI